MIMTDREHFNRIMNYQKTDKIPVLSIEPYEQSVYDRWYGEGLEEGVSIQDSLGISSFVKVPVHLSPRPRYEKKIFYEDDEYIVELDTTYGAKVKKQKNNPSMFYGYIEHQVKTADDWKRVRYRYEGDIEDRISKDIDRIAAELNKSVNPVKLEIFPYFFRLGFYLMGMENFLLAFYDQPELIHEMFSFWNNFTIKMIRPYLDRVDVDIFVLMEDLAYNKAPHLPPDVYREFWLPYQDELIAEVKKHEVENICLWSAGDIDVMIPMLMDHGVNCLWPVERCSANMDPVRLRKIYGKELKMNGGVPWKCLLDGPEAIDREIDRLLPLISEGGFIPAIDDMVSPEIELENYKYYINRIRSVSI